MPAVCRLPSGHGNGRRQTADADGSGRVPGGTLPAAWACHLPTTSSISHDLSPCCSRHAMAEEVPLALRRLLGCGGGRPLTRRAVSPDLYPRHIPIPGGTVARVSSRFAPRRFMRFVRFAPFRESTTAVRPRRRRLAFRAADLAGCPGSVHALGSSGFGAATASSEAAMAPW